MKILNTKVVYNQGVFTLRPAEEADASAIKNMVRKARLNPTGLDWPRFMVAVSESGEIVGCGQLKPHRDGSWEMASLVTVETWRLRGVASALVRYFQKTHQDTIYLMCRSSLGPYYERFGFTNAPGEGLPRYFRRVKGLVKVMELLRSEGEFLLVMRWDPLESGSSHTPPAR